MPTPDVFSWILTYWPILGGLLTTAGIAAVTLRDVRQLKLLILHHRHSDDGAVIVTADALGSGARR